MQSFELDRPIPFKDPDTNVGLGKNQPFLEFAVSDFFDPEALEVVKEIEELGYGIVVRPNTTREKWRQFREEPNVETLAALVRRAQVGITHRLSPGRVISKSLAVATGLIN
jgi:hypothetical protein